MSLELPPDWAPTYIEQRRELRIPIAGVEIIVTQDEADCTIVQVNPDPVSPPPFKITAGNVQAHDQMPAAEEWQARADARRERQQQQATKRQLLQQVRTNLGPGATEAEVMDALADAALGYSEPDTE